jgi:ferredoxin
MVVSTTAARAVEQRFPQPDFKNGHVQPVYQPPAAQPPWRAWADVGALAGALGLAAWLALGRRSRRGLFLLSVVCLAYFGFWRKGCICPVGSLQNVTLGLADPSYGIPLTVAALFLLPLVFALFFGRVFCASVCPLGAIQEMVIARPVRLPGWLHRTLGLVPHAYLALAVAFAATGAGFWICRYDPFVGLFRRGGPAAMILTGALLLAIGTVVARPYCRFLCPYGVLLNWFSRLSRRHLSITPDECIQCRLCEAACPFDAIRGPEPGPVDRAAARRALAVALLMVPFFAAAGATAGRIAGPLFSRAHPAVSLAAEIRAEDAAGTRDLSWATREFRASGETLESLAAREGEALRRLRSAMTWAGGFLGLMVAIRLVALSRRSDRKDYVADRGECLSCGRCFAHCPREYVRRGVLDGPMLNP